MMPALAMYQVRVRFVTRPKSTAVRASVTQDHGNDARVLTGRLRAPLNAKLDGILCEYAGGVLRSDGVESDKAVLQIILQIGLAIKALRDTTLRALNPSAHRLELHE